MATPSAPCRSARAARSPRPTIRCCSRWNAFPSPAAGREDATLGALEVLCGRGDAAALLVEPLVLGAGGMLMYSPPAVGTAAPHLRQARSPVHCRRGDDRLGTNRHHVRQRAGTDLAGYCLLLQGSDRRRAAAGRHPVPARDFHGALCAGPAGALFFTPAPSLPIPSPVPRHWPIWRFGKQSPCSSALPPSRRCRPGQLTRFHGDTRFANIRRTGDHCGPGSQSAPTRGICPSSDRACRPVFGRRAFCCAPLGNTIYVLPPYCVTGEDLSRVYDAIDAAADIV